ncbi:MAG: MBL fold metallo-hydrolase [bacterium]
MSAENPISVTTRLTVIPGPVNGVMLEEDGHVLAIYGDPRPEPVKAEMVLFTHFRRDAAWAGQRLVDHGAKAVVPAGEVESFTGAREFWENYQTAYFHDYAQQTSRILTRPLPVDRSVKGGDVIDWQGVKIQVLDTPGYTREAVSYLLELDGKRIACVGDLIYGQGRILDLYSLQDAINEPKTGGYHGYAARAAQVIASLRAVRDWNPDILIPARGPVIENPRSAIGQLIERLQAVYENYLSICALRWYWGDDYIQGLAGRVLDTTKVDWMPMAETLHKEPPAWIVPIQNTRVIISGEDAAFLVDCGNRNIAAEVKKLQAEGRFHTVEGIYITHYHDDHTDYAQQAAEEFGCPVFFCPEQKEILTYPEAWRMPCLTPNAIRSYTVKPEGSTIRWHEFELTFSYHPGQTLYHGGLLVKKDNGETIFFIGDSFTPSGIDDYCLLNRNFLHPGMGFFYCLNVLKNMKPDYLLINQHVVETFRFSSEQIQFMLGALNRRAVLMKDLFPWDDPNYGIDEQWARLSPYGIEARAGQPFDVQAVIFNHSPVAREFRVTLNLPDGWTSGDQTKIVKVNPREESVVTMTVTPPANAEGLTVLTADVAFGEVDLRQWTEVLVNVEK